MADEPVRKRPGPKPKPRGPWKPRGVQFQKGNLAGVKHGATSPRMIEARAAEIRARIESELDQSPVPVIAADGGLRRRYVWLSAQFEMAQERMEATGGMYTSRGTERKGVQLLLRLNRQLGDMEKLLGLGAAPRAGVLRDMSGAHVGKAQVDAIQRRLREKAEASKLEPPEPVAALPAPEDPEDDIKGRMDLSPGQEASLAADARRVKALRKRED